MDFVPKAGEGRIFPSNIPLPFYMAYPGYLRQEQQSRIIQDLEYLQQAYPGEIKRYQRKVAEILDKVDYEGSMIYDEYPDQYSMARLAGTITHMIRKEEEKNGRGAVDFPEKWIWLENMIRVLLSNEIYKRRHGGKRGFLQY